MWRALTMGRCVTVCPMSTDALVRSPHLILNIALEVTCCSRRAQIADCRCRGHTSRESGYCRVLMGPWGAQNHHVSAVFLTRHASAMFGVARAQRQGWSAIMAIPYGLVCPGLSSCRSSRSIPLSDSHALAAWKVESRCQAINSGKVPMGVLPCHNTRSAW